MAGQGRLELEERAVARDRVDESDGVLLTAALDDLLEK
jgi:hypothetical protein